MRPETTTFAFSPRVEALLKRAGWTPSRRFNADEWISDLVSEGFKQNPTAIKVLESLGGIRVKWLPGEGASPHGGEIVLDPMEEASGYYDFAEEWKPTLQTDVFPIGFYGDLGYVIWCGENGTIYLGRDYGLLKAGDCFPDAMENLVFIARVIEAVPPKIG